MQHLLRTGPDLFLFCVLFYIAAGFLSLVNATDKAVTIKEVSRLAIYVLIYFIAKTEVRSNSDAQKILKIYLLSSLIIACVGLFQYFRTPGEIAATLENPNILGAFLILPFFPALAVALFCRLDLPERVLWGFTAVLMGAAIILTHSRNAFLALVIGLVLLAVIFIKKRLILLLAGAGAVGLSLPLLFSRFSEILNMEMNVSRFKLWQAAWYMIKDHPLLGIGNGNFPVLYNQYVDLHPKELKYFYDVIPVHPHNILVKVQCELGLIGTVAFILLALSLILKYRDFLKFALKNSFNEWFYKGFAVSLVVFALMNMVDCFIGTRVELFFWLLLGVQHSFLKTDLMRL
ncbi:MAG TPA: hypothetical protein GXX46_10940 [Peptococcaceae bacterium]|nr:hypothetical protein [Peptococcaceae bacterium]